MNAFIVSVNGQQVCTAGIGPLGGFHVIVGWVRRDGESHAGEFHLAIQGLDTSSNAYLQWDAPRISVGDEVTVRIIEADAIDPPAEHEVKKPTITRSDDESRPTND